MPPIGVLHSCAFKASFRVVAESDKVDAVGLVVPKPLPHYREIGRRAAGLVDVRNEEPLHSLAESQESAVAE